jgi:hypothetical protein
VGDGAETDEHCKGDREDVLGILPVAKHATTDIQNSRPAPANQRRERRLFVLVDECPAQPSGGQVFAEGKTCSLGGKTRRMSQWVVFRVLTPLLATAATPRVK